MTRLPGRVLYVTGEWRSAAKKLGQAVDAAGSGSSLALSQANHDAFLSLCGGLVSEADQTIVNIHVSLREKIGTVKPSVRVQLSHG